MRLANILIIIRKDKGEFMYSQSLNSLIDRMALAIGKNQFCDECRRSFHSSSDGCPLCGSMRTSSLIDTGEIKIIELSYSEYFTKFGFIIIRNEDGVCEFIHNQQSCPWPREEKK